MSLHVRPVPPRQNPLVSQLLDLIKAEGLVSGDRLPAERTLAQRFGVSRPAVREALAALQSVRIIEIRSNSGAYVRPRGPDEGLASLVLMGELGLGWPRRELEQSIELRQILECQAVGLAAGRATPADLVELRSIIDEGMLCVARGESLESNDERFHLAIAKATQNAVFYSLMQSFLLPLRGRREAYFADPERCRGSQKMHQAIFETIANHAPKRAMTLMRRHMAQAENHFLHSDRETSAGRTETTREEDHSGGRETPRQ